ncbi:inverted formin-2-like [Schistocerca nitens]|uniref:inverted formin-2-like n=1 Tax=Schistocerca nitens TaxID=7011 RepID=UPI0021174932|nr:inverted formin-2-like [Schistocerca nitens]
MVGSTAKEGADDALMLSTVAEAIMQARSTVNNLTDPKPTTPPTAPLPLAPPPRADLPAPPLSVRWSPEPEGRLSPPQRPHLRPPPPPPPPTTTTTCSSAAPEPMDAEAAVTPPPPSPMEVVAPPPHPSIPSGGARPGQVFHGAFSSGTRVDSAPQQFRCLPPAPSVPPPLAQLKDFFLECEERRGEEKRTLPVESTQPELPSYMAEMEANFVVMLEGENINHQNVLEQPPAEKSQQQP